MHATNRISTAVEVAQLCRCGGPLLHLLLHRLNGSPFGRPRRLRWLACALPAAASPRCTAAPISWSRPPAAHRPACACAAASSDDGAFCDWMLGSICEHASERMMFSRSLSDLTADLTGAWARRAPWPRCA